ncbi:MAG: hypothetical protein SLAVMIC_00917 [uncultured marine phage]|uniref:Uncharacterized protein n=1 Tax=uncultured marine phage TaxID=707152 RepID=A0A8D9CCZ6_9VIRU|nr:MAG: hypothetical protein SLAVMIC_00917 [uncultured marine phage]
MLTLKQVDDSIKEVFTDQLVKSVDTVYQKKDNFYMLVISIHGLELDDTIILHTKFIFPTNLEKTGLINNKFSYLANLGCGYKYVEFEEDSTDDLKEKIMDVLNSNDFDGELRDLSEFLSESPDGRINHHLYQKGIEKISVHEVKYDPKFKMAPCGDTTYDFDLNINNNYEVNVSIKRKDPYEEKSTFDITFKLNDVETIEVESMENIGEIIGEQLIKMFEKL